MTRQVIKLGSSSIASQDGLALDVIASLVSQIAAAQRAGHEVILVTSGAARLAAGCSRSKGPRRGPRPRCTRLVEAIRSALPEPGQASSRRDGRGGLPPPGFRPA